MRMILVFSDVFFLVSETSPPAPLLKERGVQKHDSPVIQYLIIQLSVPHIQHSMFNIQYSINQLFNYSTNQLFNFSSNLYQSNPHSVLKLSTGFANAALTDSYPTVNHAISNAIKEAITKMPQL